MAVELSPKKVGHQPPNNQLLLLHQIRNLLKFLGHNQIAILVFDDSHEIAQGFTVIEMVLDQRFAAVSLYHAFEDCAYGYALEVVGGAKAGLEAG